MTFDIRPAADEQEREAIFRFRYQVYVEEMDRYRNAADHERRVLVEPDDATSRLFGAWDDSGELVGAMRLTWPGDAPFSARHIAQYDLAPFLESIPAEQMIIGERFMIAADLRGSDLLYRLFCAYLTFVNEQRIQLIFGDCEPHLLNVYLALGFRTYTRHNVNSAETGYLIPLVMVAEDLDYFRSIASPLVSVLQDFGDQRRVPSGLAPLLAGGHAVRSARLLSMEDYWRSVQSSLTRFEDVRASLFDGLDEKEVQACLTKSTIIECAKGDRLIKKGNVAQNVYVVLSGTLEVRDGDETVALVASGEIFGEIAFFLGLPRSMDVVAATDDVSVLSLSDSTMRALINEESTSAAKLLRNIARMLCFKLLNSR